jgi:hypothetical protein
MALPDMVVFNSYIQSETIELLGQMVEKFNAASNNSIVLSTTGFDGDYLQESFWNQLPIARRVDRDATNDAEAATDLTQAQHNTVKIAGGFGPVLFEPGQLTWMQKDPAEAIRVSSEALANGIMADMLNTAILGGVAAITKTATTADTGASAELTYVNLNSAHALFGDASSMIVADVMDGASYHALIGQNLANAEVLFEAQNVTVVNILGKAIVVTDAPALRVANPGKTSILGLVTNGIVVNDANDLITNTETNNGKLRIETTFQADYTFGLGIKGYAWDIANGGNSPLDAAIATGTNWEGLRPLSNRGELWR